MPADRTLLVLARLLFTQVTDALPLGTVHHDSQHQILSSSSGLQPERYVVPTASSQPLGCLARWSGFQRSQGVLTHESGR